MQTRYMGISAPRKLMNKLMRITRITLPSHGIDAMSFEIKSATAILQLQRLCEQVMQVRNDQAFLFEHKGKNGSRMKGEDLRKDKESPSDGYKLASQNDSLIVVMVDWLEYQFAIRVVQNCFRQSPSSPGGYAFNLPRVVPYSIRKWLEMRRPRVKMPAARHQKSPWENVFRLKARRASRRVMRPMARDRHTCMVIMDNLWSLLPNIGVDASCARLQRPMASYDALSIVKTTDKEVTKTRATHG